MRIALLALTTPMLRAFSVPALLILALSGPATAGTRTGSLSPLLGEGEGKTAFEGEVGVNPLSRNQNLELSLARLPGRGDLSLSLGLSFSNNFWDAKRSGQTYDQVGIDLVDVLRPTFSSDVHQYPNLPMLEYPLFPPNLMGGWRFESPAGARVSVAVSRNRVGLSPPTFECTLQYFSVTDPSGKSTLYYPSKALATTQRDCTQPWTDAQFSAFLRTNANTAFHALNGDGRQLFISSRTDLSLAVGAVSRPAVGIQVRDTAGKLEDFALIQDGRGLPGNTGGELIAGWGLPTRVTDRFGNYISMDFTLAGFAQPLASGLIKFVDVTLTDPIGRQVVVTFHPDFQFPSLVKVPGFLPSAGDLTISLNMKELVFERQVARDCLTVHAASYGPVPTGNFLHSTLTTLEAVTLPGGAKWAFDYDRGWGSGITAHPHSRPATRSDGSLAKVTSPYGLIEKFTLNEVVDDQLYQAYAIFLSEPSSVQAHCVRFGYVSELRRYQPGATAYESKEAFSTEFDYPSAGLRYPIAVTTTAETYANESDPALKTRKTKFAHQDDIEYLETWNEVSGSEGVLATETKSYSCVKFRLYGYRSNVNGYNGYCRQDTASSTIDGVETSKAMGYNVAGMGAVVNRPIYSDAVQPGRYLLLATLPVNRLNTVREFDGAIERRLTETTYYDGALADNFLNLPASIKTHVAPAAGDALSLATVKRFEYDKLPILAADLDGVSNFAARIPRGVRNHEFTDDPEGTLGPLKASSQYNSLGEIVSNQDIAGIVTTTAYDPETSCGGSQPTRVSNAANHTATTTYHCGSGLLASSTDATGQVTRYFYEEKWLRLARVEWVDAAGHLWKFAKFSYDDGARTKSESEFEATGAGGPSGPTGTLRTKTDTTYDGHGREIRAAVTHPNGIDSAPVVTETQYDALGRTCRTSNAYRMWTETSFDVLDRPTRIKRSDNALTLIDYAGRKTTTTDAHGRAQSSELDFLGRLITVVTPDGRSTTYDYDLRGNLIAVKLAGESVPLRTFTYDGLGRPLTSRLAERSGTESVLQRDARGNPTQVQLASGYLATYAYDALNRMISKRFEYRGPDASFNIPTDPVTYAYDETPATRGLLWKMTEGNRARVFAYDAAARVKSERLSIGNETYGLGYTYTGFGQLDTITYHSGRTVKFDYNSSAQLDQARWSSPTATGASFSIGAYSAHGRAERRVFGDGITEIDQYDPIRLLSLSRTTGVANTANTIDSPIARWRYGYSSAPKKCSGSGDDRGAQDYGSYAAAINASPGTLDESFRGKARTYRFQLDCLDRLKSTTVVGGADGSYGFTYDFDARYNLTAQKAVSGGAVVQAAGFTRVFDARNQLASWKYDNAGNVVEDANHTYRYDALGRLVRSTRRADGAVTQYAYLDMHRIWMQSSAGERHFVRDKSGQLFSEYVRAAAPPTPPTEAIRYYHKDLLGSVRLVGLAPATVNGPPRIESERTYLPFGQTESDTGAPATEVSAKFAGKERDSQTGNDYLGHRYYAPAAALFLALDSAAPELTKPWTWNAYVYAENNPIAFVDPDGRQAKRAALNQGEFDLKGRSPAQLRSSDDIARFKAMSGAQVLPRGAAPIHVFRGDTRPPETIFSQGFKARGSSVNIFAHVDGWPEFRDRSATISTAKKGLSAGKFATLAAIEQSADRTFIYEIAVKPGDTYTDVQEFFEKEKPLSYRASKFGREENEISLWMNVPASSIIGARAIKRVKDFILPVLGPRPMRTKTEWLPDGYYPNPGYDPNSR